MDIDTEPAGAPKKKEAARAAADAAARAAASQQLPAGLVRSIVLSYLLRHCYRDTAEAFVRAADATDGDAAMSAALPRAALDRLEHRRRMMALVRAGDVMAGLKAADALLPDTGGAAGAGGVRGFFPTFYFRLLTQHFVELVRARDTIEALSFAQRMLAPFGKRDPDALPLLQENLPLLAYKDPEKSPLGALMNLDRRDALAAELNDHVFSFPPRDANNVERQSELERLVRHLSLLMSKLHEDSDDSLPILTLADLLNDSSTLTSHPAAKASGSSANGLSD